jgi:hypothetical protein
MRDTDLFVLYFELSWSFMSEGEERLKIEDEESSPRIKGHFFLG